MKKFFSLLLSICLLVQLTSPAFAAETAGAGTAPRADTVQETVRPHENPADLTGTRVSGAQSNPLYGGEDNALRGHVTAPKFYSGAAALSIDDYLTDDAAVLEAIASGMEQRKATITVPWRIPVSAVSTDEELLDLIFAALALAMSHTGVPTQGDSLLFAYSYLEYGGEVVAQEGGYYYINAIYNVVYYTTAAQEAQLTAKLTEVMNSFGFTAQTDDYTKVKTIYDYICANVTYDEANLNNESYTLKFTPYAALINGTAVCQGYALLLYRMLLMAGVDNRVIAGTAENVDHAWNIAALNNFYYNLDSTWDAGQGEYHYFLKCPANFPNHTRLEAYDSADFHTVYPMAAADYVPGEQQPIAQGSCGEGVNWVLGNDGILTVSGTGTMDDYASASAAPWYDYRDYVLGVVVEEGVQHVGNRAFYNYPKLQALSCAAKSIGSYTFHDCDALMAVELPAGMETVGERAFNGCDTLIAVSCAAKSIGNSAFTGCDALVAVELLDGVESIGSGAFSHCASLTAIELPSTLQSLGSNAFYSCSKLTAVHIPASLQSIGSSAFYGCSPMEAVYITDLAAWCSIDFADNRANPLSQYADLYLNGQLVQDLVVPDGVTQIKPNAFTEGNFTSVTLPSGVKSIGENAFFRAKMSKVNLPLGLESIGASAFSVCESLTKLVVPEGVKTIGSAAFYASNLDEIHLPSTLESIESGAFYAISSADLYITDLAAWCGVSLADRYSHPQHDEGDMYLNGVKLTHLVIPSGTEEVKPFTFYNGSYTSVTVPAGVKIIGNSAFAGSDVADLTLPEGLLVLGEAAFDGCQSLEKVTLPETLTTISLAALRYTRIKSIRIPASVTTIGVEAFSTCYYMNTIHFAGDAPTFGKNCFSGVKAAAYYPADNDTWTEDVRQQYDGRVTWVARCAHTFEDGFCTICGAPEVLPGDFTGDELVTNADVSYLLWHTLFPADFPLNSDADFTADGQVTNADVSYLLWHTLFPADFPL